MTNITLKGGYKSYRKWTLNSFTKELSLWKMNANWEFESGEVYEKDDIYSYELETDFNTDFNKDSIIGLDKNKNGIFDDDDLSSERVDKGGAWSLFYIN